MKCGEISTARPIKAHMMPLCSSSLLAPGWRRSGEVAGAGVARAGGLDFLDMAGDIVRANSDAGEQVAGFVTHVHDAAPGGS